MAGVVQTSHVQLGGMNFVRFAGGAGRIGSSDFADNPVKDYTARPVLVGRDLVPNREMDSYIAAMADLTHALVAHESTSGRLHLLARGRVTDKESGTGKFKPVTTIVGSPDSTWAASAGIYYMVRVVPPADRLQDLSASFADPYNPACRVSLYDALGYCAWKSEVTGQSVMLPDEELWEWIATNGEGPDRKYPWGNEEPTAALAHFNKTVSVGTAKIGRHPSKEGVNDLAGNLFEWTMSLYATGQPWYSVRGGSWYNGPGYLRAAYRFNLHPVVRYSVGGFRVVVPQDS